MGEEKEKQSRQHAPHDHGVGVQEMQQGIGCQRKAERRIGLADEASKQKRQQPGVSVVHAEEQDSQADDEEEKRIEANDLHCASAYQRLRVANARRCAKHRVHQQRPSFAGTLDLEIDLFTGTRFVPDLKQHLPATRRPHYGTVVNRRDHILRSQPGMFGRAAAPDVAYDHPGGRRLRVHSHFHRER